MIEQEHSDTQARIVQRQKAHEGNEERSQLRALERLSVCAELEKLSLFERLERICTDRTYPLDFYPKEFAVLDEKNIAAMPEPLRLALIERLNDRRQGVWHKLLLRLQNRSTG